MSKLPTFGFGAVQPTASPSSQPAPLLATPQLLLPAPSTPPGAGAAAVQQVIGAANALDTVQSVARTAVTVPLAQARGAVSQLGAAITSPALAAQQAAARGTLTLSQAVKSGIINQLAAAAEGGNTVAAGLAGLSAVQASPCPPGYIQISMTGECVPATSGFVPGGAFGLGPAPGQAPSQQGPTLPSGYNAGTGGCPPNLTPIVMPDGSTKCAAVAGGAKTVTVDSAGNCPPGWVKISQTGLCVPPTSYAVPGGMPSPAPSPGTTSDSALLAQCAADPLNTYAVVFNPNGGSQIISRCDYALQSVGDQGTQLLAVAKDTTQLHVDFPGALFGGLTGPEVTFKNPTTEPITITAPLPPPAPTKPPPNWCLYSGVMQPCFDVWCDPVAQKTAIVPYGQQPPNPGSMKLFAQGLPFQVAENTTLYCKQIPGAPPPQAPPAPIVFPALPPKPTPIIPQVPIPPTVPIGTGTQPIGTGGWGTPPAGPPGPPGPPGVCPPCATIEVGAASEGPPADVPQIQCQSTPLGDPGSEAWCHAIEAAVQAFAALGKQALDIIGSSLTGPSTLAGPHTATLLTAILGGLFGAGAGAVEGGVEAARAWLVSILTRAQQVALCGIACDTTTYFGLAAFRAIADLGAHTHIGIDLGIELVAELELTFPASVAIADYLLDYFCPYKIVEADIARELYLSAQITSDQAACVNRAHGYGEAIHHAQVQAGRTRPRGREVVEQWWRGLIDQGKSEELLRQDGWLDTNEMHDFILAQYEVPPVGDIVRYMVRNVYDPGIVNTFHLDAEFGDKFGPQLQKWATANGLTTEQVTAEWRAHWQIPAPGQLYEMFQRLRPEAVNTQVNFFGADGKPNPAWQPGMVSPDQVTTIDDVARALGENDILPFWRARLLAISFNPLTRIDIRRAYNAGQLSYDELVKRTEQLGYSADDAKVIAELTRQLKIQKLAQSTWAKLHGSGGATTQEADVGMQLLGGSLEEIAEALDYVDTLGIAQDREATIKALQHRYLTGDLTDVETQQALLTAGVETAKAVELVHQWHIQQGVHGRQVTASELVKWWDDGIINTEQYIGRLIRLGYSPADASGIVQEAAKARADKTAKAEQAAAKQQAAAAKKAAADLAKLVKAKLADQAKAAKAAQADLTTAVTAAVKLGAWVDGGALAAVPLVKASLMALMETHKVSYHLAALMVRQAAEAIKKGEPVNWPARVDAEFKAYSTL